MTAVEQERIRELHRSGQLFCDFRKDGSWFRCDRCGQRVPVACSAVCGATGARAADISAAFSSEKRRMARGPGYFLHLRLDRLGIHACASCSMLAHQMNMLGPSGCRKHSGPFVEAVDRNLRRHKQARVRMLQVLPAWLRRWIIAWQLFAAIKDSEASLRQAGLPLGSSEGVIQVAIQKGTVKHG